MRDKRYSKFLTILLIIIIVGIIGLVAYLGFDYYRRYSNTQEGNEFVEAFIEGAPTDNTSTNTSENTAIENIADNVSTNTPSTSGGREKEYYQGFETIGTIEIPKTDVSYPILVKSSRKALETAVVIYYPSDPVLNTPGNIVIAGHNYRNGQFFSNNKRLSEGDEIYITDLDRNRVKYIIYDIFEASDTDTSFYNRDTDGAREITLTTCTDDSSARLIIEARAEGD